MAQFLRYPAQVDSKWLDIVTQKSGVSESLQEDHLMCLVERVCIQVSLWQQIWISLLTLHSHQIKRVASLPRRIYYILWPVNHLYLADRPSRVRALGLPWIGLLAVQKSIMLQSGCGGLHHLLFLLSQRSFLRHFSGRWHLGRSIRNR